jgi:hypothetical protein
LQLKRIDILKEGIMATRRSAVLAMLVLAAAASAPAQIPPLPTPTSAVPILQEIVATQAFEERVIQYVTLHRLLEGPLAALQPTRDMGQLQMTVRALALRIRMARADAHQGDLIGPDVAGMFRRRIATCLPAVEWAAILADNATEAEEEEGMPAAPPALRVNMVWPENVPFGFVPPQMLAALPRLPVELQYRIIGTALVLWDHHANLIVDFLPDAFAVLT